MLLNETDVDGIPSGCIDSMLILPTQFFVHSTQRPPEQRLLLEVLRDGIMCFQRYGDSALPKIKRLYTEAKAWIELEDDDSTPFSFDSCCTGLGIDAGWLRRALLAGRAGRVPRGQTVLGERAGTPKLNMRFDARAGRKR